MAICVAEIYRVLNISSRDCVGCATSIVLFGLTDAPFATRLRRLPTEFFSIAIMEVETLQLEGEPEMNDGMILSLIIRFVLLISKNRVPPLTRSSSKRPNIREMERKTRTFDSV